MTAMSLYSNVIFKTRYARWREEEKRREMWDETVERYVSYFTEMLATRHGYLVTETERDEVFNGIYALDVMPSMRALMTAGVALNSAEVANFNCSFEPVDSVRSFTEHMYVLMCGAGSGFSVERRFTEQLPRIPATLRPINYTIVVEDSRQGWCDALHQLLTHLYDGLIPGWDTSKVREEGARLKTFGGYASGPGPLIELFQHTIEMFKAAAGRKFRPVEVFSIMCYIAQIVVVGGVRRSATIALFDHDDNEMRTAKTGQWWVKNPHYAMANVSGVFESRPDHAEFSAYWNDLVASKSGEPGMLNRAALWRQCEAIGRKTRYADGTRIPFGVNPCSEIILQPYSFCNLSGVAIRPDDTLEDLKRKIRLATIIGTWQACVVKFEYLRPQWQENCEDERLLGVCLAGIMDHPVLKSRSNEAEAWLMELRDYAWEVNKEYADRIGINPTASITSVKPAGNSGELYDVASGIHPRYAKQYIRTIRQSGGDPITAFLRDNGIPWEISKQNARDVVFSFPVKAPEGAITAPEITALQQLDHWLMVKTRYSTHTVSATIYVRENEWDEVGAWVYDHFDNITGLSFLPYNDHTYEQAPYQPVDEVTYRLAVEQMPTSIDWSLLKHYESKDMTTVSQEFTCVGGACELK